MKLPKNKTKIVCTIGPASDSPEVMESMIRAGMNVARINFSYSDFPNHKEVIDNLVVLTEGPSKKHPEANHRMEIIDLERKSRDV